MKKKERKDQEQEQEWQPRRLSLNRETILVLHDSAQLELVRGRAEVTSHAESICPTQE